MINRLALIALASLGVLLFACGSDYESRGPAPAATAVPVYSVVMTAPAGLNPPNDQPYADVFFKDYGTNAFIATEDLAVSTFGMDVDTASYTVARSYLDEWHMPPEEAIRVEEFINYFDQQYPPAEQTFEIHLDGAQSRFGEDNKQLLRIGISGLDIAPEDRKDAVLTFVIDVSGSMGSGNRLELAKRSLTRLVDELRGGDSVGIVVYGSRARVVLEPTSNLDRILSAVASLQIEGATNAEAGLDVGYQMATRSFAEGKINRVILVSDGVANVGSTGPDSILETIREKANQNITLTTVGVGMGNYNDILMEQLANDGNGNYYYVDSDFEASKLFGQNLVSVLQVIASDAKIQVEFNPETVDRYRLIGYENRLLEEEDFRDDTVDAGEVGAGHTVTALYEVRVKDEADGLAATVRVRYQDPDTAEVEEIAATIGTEAIMGPFDLAPAQLRFDAAVAEFAEILHGSSWVQSSLEEVYSVASEAAAQLSNEEAHREFVALVDRAIRVGSGGQ